MEEKKLLAELTKNCKTQREKLSELMKTYDLAVLGYDMQEQSCKDVYNKVLSENEFFASRDVARTEVKVGERITDEMFDFLLSEEDFERLQTLAAPILVAQGITDQNGYYTVNWVKIKTSAMNDLVDFIIDNILPTDMKQKFSQVRRHIVYQLKLINIMRSIA